MLEDLTAFYSEIPNSKATEAPDNVEAAGTELNGTALPWARYQYAFAYNSNELPNPPRSFKELYERRNELKGKFTYVDPREANVPTGRFFVAGFLRAFGSDLKIEGR